MAAVEIEETEAAADAIAGSFLFLTSQKSGKGSGCHFFQDVSRATRYLSFSPMFSGDVRSTSCGSRGGRKIKFAASLVPTHNSWLGSGNEIGIIMLLILIGHWRRGATLI